MKLTRLELSGFKSFADPVDLSVDDGITAVVGPNGCGKSNISDAVRWVLGEQRARMLRGQRMEEVIFQGSAARRPINVADVSLYFDNSSGTLDVAYHEVVVTRRLTRDGQSEYLLNQTPVRLRDLQDLLRGTGLGSDAGVVIEARMIDRLLSDRADERRSLFEEAAGIGLYRDRRESTVRRLEKTGEDLQRLEDLISEVQTQVRSLARQRGKAERHARFTRDRFNVVIALTQRELEAFDARHAALREQRAALERQVPEARQAVQQLEREREHRVQARATALARTGEVERRLGETRLALERLEGDLKLAGERLHHASDRRERATEERAAAAEQAAQAERELEAAMAERREAEAARRSVQTELDLRTASESEVRERFAAQRRSVHALEGALHEQVERHRALAGEGAALERELEALAVQRAEGEQRLEEAEGEARLAEEAVRAAEATIVARERDEAAAQAALAAARDALRDARAREETLRAERRQAEARLAQLEARGAALRELEQRREGLAPAARSLLAQRDRFGTGAVLGPLSDFVRVDSEQAGLAEHLLAGWLEAVLVRDASAVEAIQRWHAEVQPGPLVLLPVTPGPEGVPAEPVGVDVQADAPAETWVRALLAGAHPVTGHARAVRRANGAIYLAGPDGTGPLLRRAELDTIERERQETARRGEALAAELERATAAHREAVAVLDEATERGQSARAALLEAQGTLDDATRGRLRAQRERAEAEAAVERLHDRIAERRARASEIAETLEAAEREQGHLTESIRSQQAALGELEAAQDAARDRRVHWQVEEAQVSAREQSAREREARARQALEGAKGVIAALDRELEETQSSTRDLTAQQVQWEDMLRERRVTLQELEAAVHEAQVTRDAEEAALTEVERRLDAAREERDRLTETQHKLEVEATEAQGRRQAVIERVEGEWHKPIDRLFAEAEPVDADAEALLADAQRLTDELERIGPVNALAVEEHAEEVDRLQFLETQRDDLVAARHALQQALREIDHTARQMFLQTFEAVQEHFTNVFHTLFEGGECAVRLADDGDPLHSDIEIQAAPRGKRTQRIHLLSSGERALVAISLLFAIYLTKPAPFCLLDEVDAPLDDANVMRFVRLLDEFKRDTQFIVITHNPRTMQVADAVYGVTMQEPGVSTIVGVRLGEVETSVV